MLGENAFYGGDDFMITHKNYLVETPSTNAYLKSHCNDSNVGSLYYTFNQTNGYGRNNRNWIQNDESIAFSFLLKYDSSYQLNTLSLLFGLSICNVLNHHNINAKIKWPNDIMINDKKVSGILVETKIIEQTIFIVCGIGVNINNITLPEELIHKATSLKKETNKEFDKMILLDSFIKEINHNLQTFNNKDYSFIEEVKKYNYLQNKEVRLASSNKLAIIKDINTDGSLSVVINGKEERYFGSEITLHNSYKD